jgi:hypothetical protein
MVYLKIILLKLIPPEGNERFYGPFVLGEYILEPIIYGIKNAVLV